jgi:hypothetical protein
MFNGTKGLRRAARGVWSKFEHGGAFVHFVEHRAVIMCSRSGRRSSMMPVKVPPLRESGSADCRARRREGCTREKPGKNYRHVFAAGNRHVRQVGQDEIDAEIVGAALSPYRPTAHGLMKSKERNTGAQSGIGLRVVNTACANTSAHLP